MRYDFLGGDLSGPNERTDAVTATDVPMGAGRAPGEAVFVPRSDGAAEDDGWYLMLVGDRAEGTTTLDVLPAGDPTAGAVAQVHLPVRVPLGFHGNWIPLR